MAGVYRNRIYWELLSNPPMVLKTMANTSCANTPKKCFQQFHFRALKARSQRIHDKLAKGNRESHTGHGSRKNIMHDASMNIRQAIAAALKFICKLFVVDSQQMHNRRLKVMHMHRA